MIPASDAYSIVSFSICIQCPFDALFSLPSYLKLQKVSEMKDLRIFQLLVQLANPETPRKQLFAARVCSQFLIFVQPFYVSKIHRTILLGGWVVRAKKLLT